MRRDIGEEKRKKIDVGGAIVGEVDERKLGIVKRRGKREEGVVTEEVL